MRCTGPIRSQQICSAILRRGGRTPHSHAASWFTRRGVPHIGAHVLPPHSAQPSAEPIDIWLVGSRPLRSGIPRSRSCEVCSSAFGCGRPRCACLPRRVPYVVSLRVAGSESDRQLELDSDPPRCQTQRKFLCPRGFGRPWTVGRLTPHVYRTTRTECWLCRVLQLTDDVRTALIIASCARRLALRSMP